MDATDSPLFKAIVMAILVGILAGFGALGYVIAARKIRQPFLWFMVRYTIGFVLLFLFELALLALVPSVHSTVQHLTAASVGWILGLATVSHTVSGPIIMVQAPTFSSDIAAACLGGVLFWAYVALVLAETKASRRQRLLGLAAGLAMLAAFNLFRITISIYLEWLTDVNVHNYFYLFNMAFVLLLWAGWLRTVRPKAATIKAVT